jgi:hypothetical protein
MRSVLMSALTLVLAVGKEVIARTSRRARVVSTKIPDPKILSRNYDVANDRVAFRPIGKSPARNALVTKVDAAAKAALVLWVHHLH